MGLFDWFTQEGKLTRHARRVSNRDSQPEDRDASVQWLVKDASPKAIYALLTRFDMNLTQQLKDATEKEYVFQQLVHLGEPAVGPLQEWLRQCKQFALPLRLLAQLQGEAAAIDAALGLLKAELSRSAFHPEKKKGLLVWLSEKRGPALAEAAAPFLADFDEEVRYAAAEVIANQADDDTSRQAMLGAMARPEEDSNRVRHRICEVAVQRGWPVEGFDLATRLPTGYTLVSGRIAAR